MTRARKSHQRVKFLLIAVILSMGTAAIAYSVTAKKNARETAQVKSPQEPLKPDTKAAAKAPQPIPPANSDQPAQVRALRPAGAPGDASAPGDAGDSSAPLPPSTNPPLPAQYSGVYGSQYDPTGTGSRSDTESGNGAKSAGEAARGAAPTSLADRVAASLSDQPSPPPGTSFTASATPPPPLGSDTDTGPTNIADAPPAMPGAPTGATSNSIYPPLSSLPQPPVPGTVPVGAPSLPEPNASAPLPSGLSGAPSPPASDVPGPGPAEVMPPSTDPASRFSGAPLSRPATTSSGAATGAALGALAAGAAHSSNTLSEHAVGSSRSSNVPGPATGAGYGTSTPAAPLNPGIGPTEPPAARSLTPTDTTTPSPAPISADAQAPSDVPATGAFDAPSSPLPLNRSLPSSTSAVPTANTPSATTSTPIRGDGPSDVPGDHRFEGQQTPTLAIEKSAPDEIQVDRKAVFQIQVRNTGNAPAHDVMVVDRVPRGTQFVRATPTIAPTADGLLVWQLGTIAPGQTASISIELLPKMEGEIGSVAQVTFQARASVRSVCTRPQLAVQQTAPEKVLIGQAATIHITVSNTGSGAAANVVLEEDVPQGFTHAAGRELEHAIGTLAPGASIELTLAMNAVKAGTYENKLLVRGAGNLVANDKKSIEVTAPQLTLAARGPAHRFLDRQATYAIQVANPGTAAAQNVELVGYLPKGMKYVTSDQQGQYDPQTHAVYWSLEELPAGAKGEIHVSVLPLEAGDLKLRVDGKADLGLSQSVEQKIRVEGTAELAFTVKDSADPIELGSDTTYEVQIQNLGSKADSNIQLIAQLPPGLEPTTGSGPTQATIQDQVISFAPLAGLAPDEQAVFSIHARGKAVGVHVIRVQLRSDELQVPVTKEEGTRVYSDQ